MKRPLRIVASVFAWIWVMGVYVRCMLLATDEPWQISPDWFNGHVNEWENGARTLIGTTQIGGPLAYDSGYNSGPFWLVWTIDITIAVLIAVAYTWLLVKKPRLAFMIALVFLGLVAAYILWSFLP